MGTIKPWKRVEFFLLLRTKMVEQGIPNLTRLAELASLSPSTLSNWQNGKQRPTPARLSQIADVIGMKRRDLWAVAGVLDDETEGLLAASVPVDTTIQMIRESRLSDAQQEKLIATYLAEQEAAAKRRRNEERAEAAERERRMRETVEMLESATTPSR